MDKPWADLTKEEKRDRRMADYLSGKGIKFRDARAGILYRERVTRWSKASLCEQPDRVPVSILAGNYPATYGGHTLKECMHDARILRACVVKFMEDFYESMDTWAGLGGVSSSEALELLDYKQYAWPGHGLGDDVTSMQYLEKSYMSAEEYDRLLKDPSDFGLRVLTPRVVGAASALGYFPELTLLSTFPMAITGPFTRPEVRDSFRRLIAAGEMMEAWQKETDEVAQLSLEAGFPISIGGLGIAPFDVVGNFLRGTRGVATDMFRQPEVLLETIDMICEQSIARTIAFVNATGGFNAGFPLHRGDDTFMSRKQYEKFYWPSLKKYIDALIAEGITVSCFAEGAYNHRLEYIGDFPKGWVSWQFDRTDMAAAKKAIGDTCCIMGNVPGSLLTTGTPAQVEDCCRRLIEECAPGGGYILTGGCSADDVSDPANLHAFMEAALEYGVY